MNCTFSYIIINTILNLEDIFRAKKLSYFTFIYVCM